MTELLSKAFERASELSPGLQDELAQQILDDLVGESKWNETLARSQDLLEKLSDEALAELRAGRTREMAPSGLLDPDRHGLESVGYRRR